MFARHAHKSTSLQYCHIVDLKPNQTWKDKPIASNYFHRPRRLFRARNVIVCGVILLCSWLVLTQFPQPYHQQTKWTEMLIRVARMRLNTISPAGIVQHQTNGRILSRPPKARRKELSNGQTVVLMGWPSSQSSTVDPNRDPTSYPRPHSYVEEDFPQHSEYTRLIEQATILPEVIHIPFSEAIEDVQLPPWAERWVAEGVYDKDVWGNLSEPKIDFVYTWVNGSESDFTTTRKWYEENSTLNDPDGLWLARHAEQRYRDWDELRYSIRSIEAMAPFRNRYFILSNTVRGIAGQLRRMAPSWLNAHPNTDDMVQVLVQDDYFDQSKRGCSPTFNSLTIENQMFNVKSDVDPIFAMSDDMMLGKPHAASDIWSPLFGPMMGFKTNAYSTISRPSDEDAKRFGEKPWLIYTSWLLNRRFGTRKRKGQAHFGHSITRSVSREAMSSFPGPELQSACSRFRGDFQFQMYLWYATFHYTIERHREALLWSYLIVRADTNGDGHLSWKEREVIIAELSEGLKNGGTTGSSRARTYYHVPDILESAGLEPPKVNTDIVWTSQDGPVHIKDLECFEFDLDECLAPGFSWDDGAAETTKNPVYSTHAIFDRISRQNVKCGDCFIKILLNRAERGFEPMLPSPITNPVERDIVLKALLKYQYTVMNPDALFVMVTDAEQVESVILKGLIGKNKAVGQLCLNDDVQLEDEGQLQDLRGVMLEVYTQMYPSRSPYEVYDPR